MDARQALENFGRYLAPRFNRKAAAALAAAESAIASGDEEKMRRACRTARDFILEKTKDRPAALLSWLETGAGDPTLPVEK